MNAPRQFRSPRPRWRMLFYLAGIALFLPALASAQLPVIRFVRDPDLAPGFQLKDLGGKELTLEGYRGKVILLNFWATWCGPCREEIPSLIELQKRYKDRLQIIGLVVDDDDEKMIRGVADSEGINYPVALATPQLRFAYGGIAALPTVFVLNAEGRVVQKHVGLFNPALYETEVRALLDLPVAAKVETFEDTGDIFLKHADRATILPGVNLTKLNQEQRAVALHKFNAESCDCGCKFTLAQCRIYDPACKISMDRTAAIVAEVSGAPEKEKDEAPAIMKNEKQKSEPAAPAFAPPPSPVNSSPANPAPRDTPKP
jgi:cytochrome c biogenesis protein CcmG, thiol:disulfide interchange protein DsbE